MGKIDLLGGSDSEGEIGVTINKDYAARYKQWREKEELMKLKNRYGDDASLDYHESTSEDDENAKNLPAYEKCFFTALSCLKKKDPRVFDNDYNFSQVVDQDSKDEIETDKRSKKEKPLFLRDYEQKLLVEKNGILSDEDEETNDIDNPRAASPTYVEQQKTLKESFKKALENSDDEKDEDWGRLFRKKTKTPAQLQQEEADYKEWLKGRKKELDDKETESDLKVLHDYWNDPNLNPDEVFLRDYILNKRFLEHNENNVASELNEVDDDQDEEALEEQENFERVYNFRFEEPDKDFIKQYPRNAETSFRRKDDRRKEKRREIRERKEAEMAVKREEIKRLKALKRKEILEKIEKIKEVTGNDVEFDDEDLEGEFDPEKHDKKMQEIFNSDYYGVVEEKVPECHDLDNYLEIENWENWNTEESNFESTSRYDNSATGEGPDCEDPNFIMDCDYDPKAEFQEELIRGSKSKKKRDRKKSKLAIALAKEKPVFNPDKQKFEDYFEEYYKLDCEDIIGDLPCRFKYRQTTPNSYGLTVDEILQADVKELNRWCSLKKVVKHKPGHVEKYDVKAYQLKAQNEALKRKILPSLYAEPSTIEYSNQENKNTDSKKSKKKKKTQSEISQDSSAPELINGDNILGESFTDSCKQKDKKKKRKRGNDSTDLTSETLNSDGAFEKSNEEENSSINQVEKAKKKRKINERAVNLENNTDTQFCSQKNFKKNNKYNKEMPERTKSFETQSNINCQSKKSFGQKKFKKNKKFHHEDPIIPLSDVRLKAYGVHPKKFKNKIKYGNDKQWTK